MPIPYVVSGTVYQSDGSTALASATVYLRNETSNEVISTTTDSSGAYILDAANLTSGYLTGDVITVYVFYTNYEASRSHTITSGGVTGFNLTLVAVAGPGTLRYFTVQDFYDFMHFSDPNEGDSITPLPQEVVKIGASVEAEIDRKANRKFDTNSGSYYTATLEYHDALSLQKDFFLFHTPIVSVTTFQVNQVEEGNAASWNTLTEASSQIEVDTETGRIRITQEANYPEPGAGQVRVTYTYGQTVPREVRKLAILMTARDIFHSAVARALITGRDEFSPSLVTVLDDQIESLMMSVFRPQIHRTG